jgi:hypothetical protein
MAIRIHHLRAVAVLNTLCVIGPADARTQPRTERFRRPRKHGLKKADGSVLQRNEETSPEGVEFKNDVSQSLSAELITIAKAALWRLVWLELAEQPTTKSTVGKGLLIDFQRRDTPILHFDPSRNSLTYHGSHVAMSKEWANPRATIKKAVYSVGDSDIHKVTSDLPA